MAPVNQLFDQFSHPISFTKSITIWILFCCFCTATGYYAHNKCFGTGDCIITTGYLGGGFIDEIHRWLVECSDGEAITEIWCYFMFPLKPPSNGIYPFYPLCNVRNLTMAEYYCYDKHFPVDTLDTFATAIWSAASFDPLTPTLLKCCKTPPSYKLDYYRCQWKYTHDKAGEHYDGFWIVKCDTHYVMTGMGQARNPWDNQLHWVWIQCCPVVTVPTRLLGRSYSTWSQGHYGFL